MKIEKFVIFFLLIVYCKSVVYGSNEGDKQKERHVYFSCDTKTTDGHKVMTLKNYRKQEIYCEENSHEVTGFVGQNKANRRMSLTTFMHLGGFVHENKQHCLESREMSFEFFMNSWNDAREKNFYEQNKDNMREMNLSKANDFL